MKNFLTAIVPASLLVVALLVMFHAPVVQAQGSVPPLPHVILVVDENTNYADICGPTNTSMPFLCSLKSQGSFATGYYSPTHPSIGNYMDLTWGVVSTNNDSCNPNGTGGTGCPFPYSGDNIVRELISAGKTWKAYVESLPGVCYLGGDSTAAGGQYYVHHNPIAYISDVFNSVTQCQNEVPFESSTVGFAHDLANNTLPNWALIKPNGCDDGHDCTLPGSSVPDTWLKNNVLQPLLNSGHLNPTTGDTIVIATFDEASDSDSTNGGGKTYWFMMGRNVRQNYVSNFNFYSHESTLRMMCEAAGCFSINGLVGPTSCKASSPPCSPNGGAPGAPDMAEFFTTPGPAAALSPAALSFGLQAVNTTSSSQAATLSSIGNTTVNISAIAARGDFAQTNTCPASLAPGSSCTINVTFTPTATGSRSGSISVTDNATGSPQTISLTGSGTTTTTQGYSISGTLSPTSSGSGATVKLAGGVPVLVQSAHGSFLTGNTSGTVSFSSANTAGDTILLFVRFGGATITSVGDNQPGGSNTYMSALGPTQWGVAPNSTDRWAQVFVAKSITGGSPLTITVALSGSSTHDTYMAALEYSGVDHVNPVNATAFGTGTVSANGAPVTGNMTTTVANAKAVATSWDSNESYNSTGNGTGYTTDAAAGIPSISGGKGWANLTEDRTAATTGIWNASASSQPSVVDWAIQLIALAPVSTAIATADTSGNYIFGNLSNGSYTVTPSNSGVTFTPTSQGATINSASVTGVNFTAQGSAAPIVSLSATSLNFGNQAVNTTSAAQTVTLNNTGGATLTITSIAAIGDYAQTNTCGASVAAGGACTISVTFTPTAMGTRTGTITFSDNNVSAATQTVNLTGTGVAPPPNPPANFVAAVVGAPSPPTNFAAVVH